MTNVIQFFRIKISDILIVNIKHKSVINPTIDFINLCLLDPAIYRQCQQASHCMIYLSLKLDKPGV